MSSSIFIHTLLCTICLRLLSSCRAHSHTVRCCQMHVCVRVEHHVCAACRHTAHTRLGTRCMSQEMERASTENGMIFRERQGPARSPAHILKMVMELVRVAGGGERCNAWPLEVSHPKPIWNFH